MEIKCTPQELKKLIENEKETSESFIDKLIEEASENKSNTSKSNCFSLSSL